MFYLQISEKESRRADSNRLALLQLRVCLSTCASLYWCVRKLRSSMHFLLILRSRFVHCVPVRTSSVAVRFRPVVDSVVSDTSVNKAAHR